MIFGNLTTQIGRYLGRLCHNAGRETPPTSEVWVSMLQTSASSSALEVDASPGLQCAGVLANEVDLAVSAPGLAVGISRLYRGSVDRRYALGPFGRGWSTPWSIFLRTKEDGTVEVHETDGSVRRFQPDRRTGGYFSPSARRRRSSRLVPRDSPYNLQTGTRQVSGPTGKSTTVKTAMVTVLPHHTPKAV